MQQVALYFPYILPPDEWIKHSLLMFDGISSIVPPDLPPPAMGDLAWLEGEGLWSPTTVRTGLSQRYIGEVEDTLLHFADQPDYRFSRSGMPPPGDLTRIYMGKLTHQIEDAIKELGLGHLGRIGGHVAVHRDVASAILAITAKHVASQHRAIDSRLVPCTDTPSSVERAYTPIGSRVSRYESVDLILTGLAPVPGPLVSFDDVVHFRRRHADEVFAFRSEIDKLVQEVQKSEDPLDAIRSARAGIEAAVTGVRGAAKSQRIQLFGTSVAVAALVTMSHQALSPETFNMAFDGFAAAGAVTLSERLTRGRAKSSPYTFLLQARAEYGSP